MIDAERCPVCGERNPLLASRCVSCGAYVRDRVATLDLFSTMWGTIEAPGSTFMRIARSEQKNYTHLLFAAAGPALLSLGLVVARAGDLDTSFAMLFLLLVLGGPVVGLALGFVSAMAVRTALRSSKIVALRYRDCAAAVAWSLTPVAWISAIILPLQLGLFGITFFSRNPAAWTVRPLPFWMLASVEAAAILWSVVLLSRSLSPYGSKGALRALPPIAVVTATASAILLAVLLSSVRL